MIIQNCSTAKQQHFPTGSKSGCIEGLTVLYVLAKDDFKFTETNIHDIDFWKTSIQNKHIIPLFEVYELSNENTEAQKYESRNFVYETQKAVKKLKSELYLTICQHKALKSYEDSNQYVRIFEITEKLEVLGVEKSDGLYGQKLKDFNVSIRNNTTSNKAATTTLTLTYSDYEEFEKDGFIIIPGFDLINELSGISGIKIEVLTVEAHDIRFKAFTGCSNTVFDDLVAADLNCVNDAGVEIPTSLTYNATTKIYALTTTSSFTDMTLSSNVFESNGLFFEVIPIFVEV